MLDRFKSKDIIKGDSSVYGNRIIILFLALIFIFANFVIIDIYTFNSTSKACAHTDPTVQLIHLDEQGFDPMEINIQLGV